VPWLGSADFSVSPGGNVSSSTTFVASLGPALKTVML
jgi:hypothetical protein